MTFFHWASCSSCLYNDAVVHSMNTAHPPCIFQGTILRTDEETKVIYFRGRN